MGDHRGTRTHGERFEFRADDDRARRGDRIRYGAPALAQIALIDVDADGTTILRKTAAHREPKPAEGPRYGKIDYSLSRVTLATGEVEPITLLRNHAF